MNTNGGWSVTDLDIPFDCDGKRAIDRDVSAYQVCSATTHFESAGYCSTIGFVNERRKEVCDREGLGDRSCAVF